MSNTFALANPEPVKVEMLCYKHGCAPHLFYEDEGQETPFCLGCFEDELYGEPEPVEWPEALEVE